MKTEGRNQYLSIESYSEAIDILDKFTTLILFSFAKHSAGVKDTIIRNFIARAIVSLNGIMRLWQISDYQDCWILNRCILDRLFHLKALAECNTFELFEKWSFKQQYDYMNTVRSDPDFKGKLNPDFFKEVNQQKERYAAITKEKPRWKRPEAEAVAKNMDLMFLYKYGYHYASSLVHPMANDGQEDFLRQTKLIKKGMFPDQILVIHNSCLIVSMLIQEGLKNSNLAWRGVIYNFLDNFRDLFRNGSKDYLLIFLKIGKLRERNVDLCENKSKD